MNNKLKGYLQLSRPANLPTSAADVIAGMSIAGLFERELTIHTEVIILLISASVLLYAGGVVLNDVFDIEIDRLERPDRPIPSGVVPLKSAAIFGGFLLFFGILLAFVVNQTSGVVAFILTLSILGYDAFSKKKSLLGPLNMGVCRGLNLLLGISVLGDLTHLEYLAVPIVFISAITMVSRGEVHGNNKKNVIFAGFLYATVLFLVMYFHTINVKPMKSYLFFLVLFAFMVFFPLVKAFRDNSPLNIKKAVVSGVMGIIALDAAIAVAYSGWMLGILIILLLPLSLVLAKIFAVT